MESIIVPILVLIMFVGVISSILYKRKHPISNDMLKEAEFLKGEYTEIPQAVVESIKLDKEEKILFVIKEIMHSAAGSTYFSTSPKLKNLIVTSKRLIVPDLVMLGQKYGTNIYYNKNDVPVRKMSFIKWPVLCSIESFQLVGNCVEMKVFYRDNGTNVSYVLYSSVAEKISEAITKNRV